MISMTASEMAQAVEGVLYGDGAAQAVSTDSRSIPEGSLFVPLKGERFDGHAYIDSALEKGAAGCLCSTLPETLREDRFYIQVADTRLALKALASHYRDKFDIPFIQITGSVGKTTTKEMIAAVLSRRFRVHRTAGNFNNDIGVPLTLFGLEPDHQAAVIETGMNHFGEIRYLGEMIRPHYAVISNIGDAHIEFLGSREGILQAKAEIFENLDKDGVAVLSGDDAMLNTLDLSFRTIHCGRSEHCSVRVSHVVNRGVKGISCTVTTAKAEYPLQIPALGEHMIYPAAMAVAIGEELGMTVEEICAGVADYRPAGSRMRLIPCSHGRVILDDCYNANPQSMGAALEILSKEPVTVAVLGDMGELGHLSEEGHRQMGELARSLGIGTLIAIGEKSRAMVLGAAGMDARWFARVEEALPEIAAAFTDGAVVLVKASHAMHFERITEYLQTL